MRYLALTIFLAACGPTNVTIEKMEVSAPISSGSDQTPIKETTKETIKETSMTPKIETAPVTITEAAMTTSKTDSSLAGAEEDSAQPENTKVIVSEKPIDPNAPLECRFNGETVAWFNTKAGDRPILEWNIYFEKIIFDHFRLLSDEMLKTTTTANQFIYGDITSSMRTDKVLEYGANDSTMHFEMRVNRFDHGGALKAWYWKAGGVKGVLFDVPCN